MIIRDILYGSVSVPAELMPFLRIPEFVRLRGVRLSNVDSIEFKDLNGPSRWEHAIGVLHLSEICAQQRGLSQTERLHLALAALLHDIATPPFAHTAEYVLSDFDHELETSKVLSGTGSADVAPGASIYLSELSRFREACSTLSRAVKAKVDADEVARMVIGEGDLGFLISGTLDLDNADNVARASHYMGIEVDPHLPERLALFLGKCDGAPLDLATSPDPDIHSWLTYREEMYGAFYHASSVERGREAFLQHLFRRAVDLDIPRHALVWNTDEGFLSTLERFRDDASGIPYPLRDVVRRYRLLEDPFLLLTLDILDPEELRVLKAAEAASWIEAQLTTEFFEAVVSVSARRFASGSDSDGLIAPAAGQIQLFKLGSGVTWAVLPDWLRAQIPAHLAGKRLRSALQAILARALSRWVQDRPWLDPSPRRRDRAKSRLDAMGDWSFRQTRNLSLHTYPSTFVHAIPASLIHALGLRGELIVDPFGGTGNTAIEAVKAGGRGVSADSNLIASLIAKTRMTYLDGEQRDSIYRISVMSLLDHEEASPPALPLIEKWHHPRTLSELLRIKSSVLAIHDESVRRFMTIAFSAILPSTTARKGEQHGFFADNTPLAKGQSAPPYINAPVLMVERVRKNLRVLEATFASLEGDGAEAEKELLRAQSVRADVRISRAADYGLAPKSAAAVITSPPYVGMTDYTLGHRLSYHWLFPEAFSTDFQSEIGARRMRSRLSPDIALETYLSDLRQFSLTSAELLRTGGTSQLF